MAKLYPSMIAAVECNPVKGNAAHYVQAEIKAGRIVVDAKLFNVRFQLIRLLQAEGVNIHDFDAVINYLSNGVMLGKRLAAVYVDFVYFGEF